MDDLDLTSSIPPNAPTSKDRTSKRLSSAQAKAKERANGKRMTAVGMDQMKPAADRFGEGDGRPHSPAPFSQYAQPNGGAGGREEMAMEEEEKKAGCCGGCVIM